MHTPVNTFKQALLNKQAQIGLWLALADAYCTEILAGTGFDWLLVDGEHAPNDVRSVLAQLQSISSAASVQDITQRISHAVVRPPFGHGEAGTALIKQYLDIGAQTLLVPMVETPEQAEQLVLATRYPPQGVRGMASALVRASRWQRYPRYIQEANEQICLLVQVESVAGMDQLDAIAATQGVDGVFIGPADLSASMGFPGDPNHPQVQAAMLDGINRILQADKAPGILSTTETQARKWLDAGALFVAVGVDTMLLSSAASDLRARFRPLRPV